MKSEFIQKMRVAGKLAASTLEMISEHIRVGVTTNELNDICHAYIVAEDAIPAPLGYPDANGNNPFPKSICTSLNQVVCHGIPDDKQLQDGDILNIDVSLSKDGVYADTCMMFFIGKPSIVSMRVVKCAQEALYTGIATIAPGVSLRRIGTKLEKVAKQYGYSIVKDFCGHGIGTALHTQPEVLNYDEPSYEQYILKPGMTFTIEPMINAGKSDVRILKDGWTVVTKDRSLSAQFEHTVLVTETGFEILTLRNNENLGSV